MVNLEVLALSKMNFYPRLPVSIGKLKKLRTLHLERCKLGEINVISELSSLVVLSLRESILEQGLPFEVGNLSNLSLLDMSGCKSKLELLISDGTLERLSQLEGLYTLDSSMVWTSTHIEFNHDETTTTKYNDVVSANELNGLQYLNAIEMSLSEYAQLPKHGQFVKNLDMFRIGVESINDNHTTVDILGCQRILSIGFFDLFDNSCLMALLKKADWLQLGCQNVEYLVPDLDKDGLQDLVFLEVLGVQDLKAFCDRDAPSGMFQKLQNLILRKTNRLQYVLPLAQVPRNLTHVQVEGCHLLNFFFIDNGNELEERDVIVELPYLKSLKLFLASSCQSLLGTKINHALQGSQVFFNKKIGLPSLEQVSFDRCPKIIKLWSKEVGHTGFHNLREIKIVSCPGLINVGTPSIFSALVLLESLTINCCNKIQQVIADESEELEIHCQVIIFPQLKNLTIGNSSSLLCFYNGRYKLVFPSLKSLSLANLDLMNTFSGSDCSSAAFFSEKVDFPCLEELQVISKENHVKSLWDQDISTVEGGKTVIKNHVPMLRNLTISGAHALKSLPSISYADLSCLKVQCLDNQVLYSSSTLPLALPNLEELRVGESNSLKELFENESSDVAASTAATICGRLKALHLFTLPGLNQLPLDQFDGLCRLNLDGLSWEYVISADLLIRAQGALQQLEVLIISDCQKLGVVILDDIEGDEDFVIKFSRLKQISLGEMNSLEAFSSAKNVILSLPSLESLEVDICQAFKQFSSGPIIAPCLKTLHLHNCSLLECFSSSQPNRTLRLPSLENVNMYRCDNLESFSQGHVEMPKLSEVSLDNCPKIQCFLSASLEEEVVLSLLCLETLEIKQCGSMVAFSLSVPLMAPNLSYMTYNWKKYSLLEIDNLNEFLQRKARPRF